MTMLCTILPGAVVAVGGTDRSKTVRGVRGVVGAEAGMGGLGRGGRRVSLETEACWAARA